MSDNPFPLSRDELLDIYQTMRTIREFEERVHVEFSRGDIPGFVHLYAGEEASAAGIMTHLRQEDRIASTHRGHGHCIAKGVDLNEMMAELLGKTTGTNKGKGGTMHIADIKKGMLGANGVVGSNIPVAAPYTHLRAHETSLHLVCRPLLEKNKIQLPRKVAAFPL